MRTNYRFHLNAAALATMTILLAGCFNAEDITNNTVINTSQDTGNKINTDTIRVPKCCDIESSWSDDTYTCKTKKMVNYSYDVYDSNATHINTVSVENSFSVYHQPITCNESRFLYDEHVEFPLGLIYNASMILVDIRAKEISLVPPSNYCVEYLSSRPGTRLRFQVCGKATPPIPTIEYHFYFGFLVLSTMCYFGAAIFYIFILKTTDIHQKCFVAFTISMGFAFLFLIFLHTVNTRKCILLGVFFYLFAVSGFLWLTFLCLDLVVEVKFFNRQSKDERLWYYGAAGIVYPAITLFISIIPDGNVDVPDSFIKRLYYGQVSCSFNNPRVEPFFVSVGILMLASLVFLILTIYYIRVNNRDYRNNFSWLDQRSNYKYMFRSCLLIWIISLVWILETIVSSIVGPLGNNALYLIQAAQGICAFLIFVSNRYMRKIVINNCRKPVTNNDTTDVMLERFGPSESDNGRLNRQESTDLITQNHQIRNYTN